MQQRLLAYRNACSSACRSAATAAPASTEYAATLLTLRLRPLIHGRTFVVSMVLRLHCWPMGGCGDTTKATTGCQVGLRQDSRWGHNSIGRLSRGGFARRTCRWCLLLVRLFAAAPRAAAARGYTRAAVDVTERITRQRQRCLELARHLVYATLGARLANPKRLGSYRPENAGFESHITITKSYHYGVTDRYRFPACWRDFRCFVARWRALHIIDAGR